MMLAEMRREYVLTTIDPAIAPNFKSEPERSLICLLGAMLGAISGIFVALVRHYAARGNN